MPIEIKDYLTRVRELVGAPQIIIIVILIFSLIYFSENTKWIPPIRTVNATDANNQTVQMTGIYSYAYHDYIPKVREFEAENYIIPKGAFEIEKAMLMIILIIILQALNIRREV